MEGTTPDESGCEARGAGFSSAGVALQVPWRTGMKWGRPTRSAGVSPAWVAPRVTAISSAGVALPAPWRTAVSLPPIRPAAAPMVAQPPIRPTAAPMVAGRRSADWHEKDLRMKPPGLAAREKKKRAVAWIVGTIFGLFRRNPDGLDKRPAEAGCSRRKRIFMGGGGAPGAIEDCGRLSPSKLR